MTTPKYAGNFVTVEGIDGSGKTSVVNELSQRLGAIKTEEPTDSLWTGKIVRESFEERDVEELTRFYLFMADRVEHYHSVLKPKLEAGKFIICDRGPDSTRAYQYHTAGLSSDFIEDNLRKTIQPDLTIWLDVSVSNAIDRMGGEDAFEKYQLLGRVRERYEYLWASNDRIKRVGADQELEGVIEDSIKVINDHYDR